jgi:hypothetical protein
MSVNVAREVAALQRLSTKQLRHKFAEVFGDGTNANNRTWLVRRIAWRLQCLAEGGLSDRARERAAELACDAGLRLNPPLAPAAAPAPTSAPTRTVTRGVGPGPDRRLPPPGTVLARPYKGGTVRVTVLDDGFEFDGAVYGSLSAAAKAATGTHCNGFAFFGLPAKGGAA